MKQSILNGYLRNNNDILYEFEMNANNSTDNGHFDILTISESSGFVSVIYYIFDKNVYVKYTISKNVYVLSVEMPINE